ncbi:hypothetical protein BOC59_02715 [Burkholderia pseudomallei]|nr:hypothetical protein BOC59_02715 [Burkholderia pseudomallei]
MRERSCFDLLRLLIDPNAGVVANRPHLAVVLVILGYREDFDGVQLANVDSGMQRSITHDQERVLQSATLDVARRLWRVVADVATDANKAVGPGRHAKLQRPLEVRAIHLQPARERTQVGGEVGLVLQNVGVGELGPVAWPDPLGVGTGSSLRHGAIQFRLDDAIVVDAATFQDVYPEDDPWNLDWPTLNDFDERCTSRNA